MHCTSNLSSKVVVVAAAILYDSFALHNLHCTVLQLCSISSKCLHTSLCVFKAIVSYLVLQSTVYFVLFILSQKITCVFGVKRCQATNSVTLQPS